MTFKRIALVSLVAVVLLGVFFRFYNITQNQFVYYDEGMWLNEHRGFVELVDQNPPKNLSELFKILNVSVKLSLTTAKSLWTFLSHLRALVVGADGLYFTRVVSAVCGSLTLVVIYFFSRRYYDCRWTALLAVGLLAIFPSHIYYSRLALQEAFSTLFFCAGLYWYLFPRKLHWKTFLSVVLLVGVFLSNYRMIITPFLIGFSEVFVSLSRKEKINWRKYVWHTVIFLFLVFALGSLNDGANTRIIFSWIFYQKHLAVGTFHFMNLFSYPYYLFRLESVFFGLLFFGNIYLIIRRQWNLLFPFALTILMMGLFSFSQEKGVRYLCAVMPLMVMAVSGLVVYLIKNPPTPLCQRGEKYNLFQKGMVVTVIFMFGIHLSKSNAIAHFSSDYEQSMKPFKEVKVLSTQNQVQKLYASNPKNVSPAPHQLNHLVAYYMQGYRYLMIDPQAYVSYTKDKKRFTLELEGYLEFVMQNVSPIKIFPHFSPLLLERFVLEHNEHLNNSLEFLRRNADGKLGELRVYDIKTCLEMLRRDREK